MAHLYASDYLQQLLCNCSSSHSPYSLPSRRPPASRNLHDHKLDWLIFILCTLLPTPVQGSLL